jgi:hypothetical protein
LMDSSLDSGDDDQEWRGGIKDDEIGREKDAFFLTDAAMIKEMLMPLDMAVRKTCYVSVRSRCVASLVAKKMAEGKKSVMMRYLKKI